MKEYQYWLRIENLRPVRFYRYTSGVDFVILTQDHNFKTEEHDFLEELGNQIKLLIEDQVNWDNKVVVECSFINPRYDQKAASNIFIGCYDGKWSVGLGVWGDEWITPKELE